MLLRWIIAFLVIFQTTQTTHAASNIDVKAVDSYKVDLKFNQFTPFGTVKVTFWPENTGDTLELKKDGSIKVYDLPIWYSPKLECADGTTIKEVSFPAPENITITLEPDLSGPQQCTLTLYYEPLETGDTFFYNEDKSVIISKMTPAKGSNIFPYFDWNGKPEYTINISPDASYQILTNNMKVNSTKPINIKKGQLEPHQVGFVLIKYIDFETDNFRSCLPNCTQKTITAWSNHTLRRTETLTLAVSMIDYISDMLHKPFFFEQLDLLNVNNIATQVQDTLGLIIFRENELFGANSTMSAESYQKIVHNTMYLIAKQWFSQVNDESQDAAQVWLITGLSKLYQYLALSNGVFDTNKRWRSEEQFVLEILLKAFPSDEYNTTLALNANYEWDQMDFYADKFSEEQVAKSVAVLNMMHDYFGLVFTDAMIKYMADPKSGNANQFFCDIQNVNNEYQIVEPELPGSGSWIDINCPPLNFPNLFSSVKSIFGPWFDMKGYPVVTARRSNQVVTVSFKSIYDSDLSHLLISWTSANKSETQKVWIKDGQESTIDVVGDWYLINVGVKGYYRVNYDEANWNALNVSFKEFDAVTRSQIFSDVMYAARTVLDYETALEFFKHLQQEDDYIVLKTMLHEAEFLWKFLQNDGMFKEFFVNSLSYVNTTSAWEELDENQEHLDRLKVTLVTRWLCRLEEETCVNNSISAYNSNDTMNTDMIEIINCTFISERKTSDFNQLYSRLQTEEDLETRRMIISALGCSKNPADIKSYFNEIVNQSSPYIRSNEKLEALKYILGYTGSMEFVANETLTNLICSEGEEMMNSLGNYGFGKFLSDLATKSTNHIKMEEIVEQLKNLTSLNSTTIEYAINQVLDRSGYNYEWSNKHNVTVKEWFKKNRVPAPQTGDAPSLVISLLLLFISYITCCLLN